MLIRCRERYNRGIIILHLFLIFILRKNDAHLDIDGWACDVSDGKFTSVNSYTLKLVVVHSPLTYFWMGVLIKFL